MTRLEGQWCDGTGLFENAQDEPLLGQIYVQYSDTMKDSEDRLALFGVDPNAKPVGKFDKVD